MNTDSRRAVFAETHKAIDDAAQAVVDSLSSSDRPTVSYPPGIELSPDARKRLSEITISPEAKEVLRKIIADACSQPVFHLLSLLDGVTEPYVIEVPDWVGGALETDPDGLMLHDEFLDTYLDYEEKKNG